jgi:hypothetical protein
MIQFYIPWEGEGGYTASGLLKAPELQRLSVTVEVLRVGVMIVGVISVGVMTVGVITLSRIFFPNTCW